MKIDSKYLPLILYQFSGGLIGLGLTIYNILSVGMTSGVAILLFGLFILLHIFSIYCCVLIYINPLKGLVYSRLNQWLQLVSFYILGYGYSYVAGIFLSLNFDIAPAFDFNIRFGLPTWQLNINQNSDSIAVGINLVALFLIIYCDKQINKLRSQEIIEGFDILNDQPEL